MPVTKDGYRKLTEEEIFIRLKADFESTFDSSVEPGDIIEHQLRAEAKTLAENQEAALERVYQSANLNDATETELEKLVALVGLSRREKIAATGVIEFTSTDPPTATYTIPSNEKVQTEGSDPIEYRTTEQSALTYLDGFEGSLDNWTGDKTDFTTTTTDPLTGSASLEVPATAGVELTSVKDDFTLGTTFNFNFRASSGSITTFKFGVHPDGYHECTIDASADNLDLRSYEAGVEVAGISVNETIPTATDLHVELEWSLHGDLRAAIYQSSARDTLVRQITLAYTPSWSTGSVSIRSEDGTATSLVDEYSNSSVIANIRAENGGVQTNVGADNIVVAPNGLTGVQSLTNPVPTGDVTLENTNLSPFVLGRDEEGDEELRQRAFENSSIGGAASLSAIEAAIDDIEGVQSVTINRNRESTSVDGLPAKSFEPIVYGGLHSEIAAVLHEISSIDSNDVGGVNGTEVTYEIESDASGQIETYRWSEPTEIQLNITLDLVVDENYIGDDEISSLATHYIGGTDLDGSQVGGLNNGEDVYEAVLMGILVDPIEHGVWEVDAITIDDNSDGTDDTTTTTSGADVYAVTDGEVAITNARDGSITVNTTLK